MAAACRDRFNASTVIAFHIESNPAFKDMSTMGGVRCTALEGNDVIIEKLLSLAVVIDSRNHDLTPLMITAVNLVNGRIRCL